VKIAVCRVATADGLVGDPGASGMRGGLTDVAPRRYGSMVAI